jgi:fructokinase
VGYRIGIDLGGTKTEFLLLSPDGLELLRRRVPTPAGYEAALEMLAGQVRAVEDEAGLMASVGIGIPGTISPATGLVKNANSNALNGHALDTDLSRRLDRDIRVANDANCFALSEATDGAAAGAGNV